MVGAIRERFADIPHIACEYYAEIFNRKAQNFRLQKQSPALILARKHNKLVLSAPVGYGIGGKHNYYFSHMLNCIYDCRYCFLQGMYRSANYVLFINYDEFKQALNDTLAKHGTEEVYFFSGYDCDSLALEPVSHFTREFLTWFAQHPRAILEIRTKSTQIRHLLEMQPLPNVVIAYSFTPASISQALEHKVPELAKRIHALQRLQAHGWSAGLRFDPIIYDERYRENYSELFARVFAAINAERLHSVSLGMFRLPEAFYKNIQKLYPDEKLFALNMEKSQNMISYPRDLAENIFSFCETELLQYIDKKIYFPCYDS